jgi:hypothetical protein
MRANSAKKGTEERSDRVKAEFLTGYRRLAADLPVRVMGVRRAGE